MSYRPTREDTRMRETLLPMLLAILFGFILLVVLFIWLFKDLLL